METIILLPPLAATARTWRRQVDAFGTDFSVLTPDLPGHGSTPGPFTLDRAVAEVTGLLDREPGPVHLVGLSLSATVAVQACLARPGRLDSLVLSGGIAAPPPALAVQRAVAALVPARVMAQLAARVLAPTLGGLPESERARTVSEATEDFRAVGRRTYLDALRELARTDLRPRLGEVTTPTLVLCGSRDKANLRGAQELAEGIPAARLEIVPGVGHLWHLERPEIFSRTIGDFVRENAL
ncbi:alpha/beta fold hydrolase [Micromonospora narathiwatensis]|uniref:Pimeloyl-ACP methyl ester carboxylesterase n=1 Tax=Micromonospora narathiwatensis TaxID=299146 RepID=A0A1A9ADS9_9ACTN|nr:alpha/beta fold hydrolase [Micromonospora narathiwatensis]SBT54352.1 Pimeloyl-ACP methyl ester carboxylesterase [Micromonospora narathiwatensis]